MAKDTPITAGGTTKATPVPKTATTATNLSTQRVKHDLLVSILGQTANTLTYSANVLPSESVDPRYHNGKELIRVIDGSAYSGVYLVSEVTTTYANGQRSRTIAGTGHAIDGANPSKIIEDVKSKATTTLPKASETKPTGSNSSGGNTSKEKQPPSSKTTTPPSDMYYKDGKWYKA